MFLWDSIRARFGRAGVPDSPLFRSHFALVDDSAWRERLAGGDASVTQVYADWLEEQGDGRAELMRRASTGDELEAFLSANGAVLLGPLALLDRARADRPELELTWEAGLLRGAAVRPDDPARGHPWDLARVLMQGPIGKDLRSLAIGVSEPWAELTSADRLDGLEAPLRSLLIGDFTPSECPLSWAALGDLRTVWKHFPRLESLTLRGGTSALGDIEAPMLRRFVIETTSLTHAELDSIGAARWPALESLELWAGDEQWASDVGWDALRAVLERPWPRLTSLAIRNCIEADLVAEWLVGSPLLPQLERVDFSLGALSDAGAERLLAGRERLAHLESLDLGWCELSPQHLEALKTLAPRVVLDGQRKTDFASERSVAVVLGE